MREKLFRMGVEATKDVASSVADETLNTAKWMAMKYLIILPTITFFVGGTLGFIASALIF